MQYITGPRRISGAMALHRPTSAEPIITGGFPATIAVANCTATCGLDWSSWNTKCTGRPPMPAVSCVASYRWIATCSAVPRNAPDPVSGSTTSTLNGSGCAASGAAAANPSRATAHSRLAMLSEPLNVAL